MSVFVTDTHPALWFFGGKHGDLSPKALSAFQAAEAGNGFIYVPAVVLWEAAILERKGKIKLHGGFSRWAETLLKNSGFGIAPLEPAVIALAVVTTLTMIRLIKRLSPPPPNYLFRLSPKTRQLPVQI